MPAGFRGGMMAGRVMARRAGTRAGGPGLAALTGKMVIPEGLEPPTYRLGICRSILMSYGTTRGSL